MSQVIPLRRPPINREPLAQYVSPSPEARAAMASLEGRFGALKRIFAGNFTTADRAAEIERLTVDIEVGARLVRRLSR